MKLVSQFKTSAPKKRDIWIKGKFRSCGFLRIFTVAFLLFLMINDLSEWVFRKSARCVGLSPYCGQDGYRAQVLQHPIDTYRYITTNLCMSDNLYPSYIFLYNPKLIFTCIKEMIFTIYLCKNENQK